MTDTLTTNIERDDPSIVETGEYLLIDGFARTPSPPELAGSSPDFSLTNQTWRQVASPNHYFLTDADGNLYGGSAQSGNTDNASINLGEAMRRMEFDVMLQAGKNWIMVVRVDDVLYQDSLQDGFELRFKENAGNLEYRIRRYDEGATTTIFDQALMTYTPGDDIRVLIYDNGKSIKMMCASGSSQGSYDYETTFSYGETGLVTRSNSQAASTRITRLRIS